jgi:hypothetical protein
MTYRNTESEDDDKEEEEGANTKRYWMAFPHVNFFQTWGQ